MCNVEHGVVDRGAARDARRTLKSGGTQPVKLKPTVNGGIAKIDVALVAGERSCYREGTKTKMIAVE